MLPQIVSAQKILSTKVVNLKDETLGKIEDLMLDFNTGRVAYAVMSFGGILGIGNKMFAIPWSLMTMDPEGKNFILNVDKETLKEAPGFEHGQWPDVASGDWHATVCRYYGYSPYWDEPSVTEREDRRAA